MSLLFASLCGVGSKEKRLPDFVYELDDDGFEALYESLVRGDGYVDAAGQLKFEITSQRLAAGVSFVLSQHGRPHGWSFRPSKGAWALRTRKNGERATRYSIKAERRRRDQFVYDLSVKGTHTFVDGIGRVLLHNTDSAFIRGVSRDEFESFVKSCNEDLYPPMLTSIGCVENKIEMAYEKQFKRLMFASAKRYLASWVHYGGKEATADSAPEIKGVEYVRGDTAKLARKLQGVVIDMLVGGMHMAKDGSVPTSDVARYHALIAKVREYVLKGDLPGEYVKISKAVQRALDDYAPHVRGDGTETDGAHIAVAKILRDRGEQVSEGTKIQYVVTDATKSPMTVIPASDYTGVEADRFYLWESLVYPATMRLLQEAFPDEDWEAWLKVRPRITKQTKLEEAGQLRLDVDRGLDVRARPSKRIAQRRN